MTDLYESGTVVVTKGQGHAIYLGASDRGLHALAATETLAPFYTNDQGDRPNMRWAVWSPRRVRESTILGTLEDRQAEAAERRRLAAEEREAGERYESERREAARIIADALDKVAGLSSYAYQTDVRFYRQDPGDNVVAAAKAVAKALERIG